MPITFSYTDENAPGPYPIPPDPLIEGGPNSNSVVHAGRGATADENRSTNGHEGARRSFLGVSSCDFVDGTIFRTVTLTETDKVLHYRQEGRPGQLEVDVILVSIGRVPNVEGLGLKGAGVAYTAQGVTVDNERRVANFSAKLATLCPHVCTAPNGLARFAPKSPGRPSPAAR